MKKINSLKIILILILFSANFINAKTRWSSLHLIPDADLFGSGEFTLGIDGLIAMDTGGSVTFKPSIPIKMGISEWFNIEVGYSGGVNLGLKARLWGETGKIMPSISIGIHNTITNKEVGLFSVDSSLSYEMAINNITTDTSYKNLYPVEIFLAMGKTIDPIKMRLHFGVQSVPTSNYDKINLFAAVEKYFGYGLYASLEFFTRYNYKKGEEVLNPHLSAFVNWRFLKKHLELTVGVIDIGAIFFDEKGESNISLSPREELDFVNPGIWAGLKFHGRFGRMGKNSGFKSIEDRMRYQDEMLEKMAKQVDSLTIGLEGKSRELSVLKNSVDVFIDSVTHDPTKLSNIIFNKLITLKALYEAEPYEPRKVKQVVSEIRSYRDKAIVPLQRFLLDKETDRQVRIYSAQLLGEIGASSSVDILLDVLSTAEDPDIKIEILIALGKMKETRAMFLMEQLANSPNDAIAITAQEVLFRLSKETGASIRQGMDFRKDFDTKKDSLPEPIIESKSEPIVVPNESIIDTSMVDAEVQDTLSFDLEKEVSDSISPTTDTASDVSPEKEEITKDEKNNDTSKDEDVDKKDKKRDRRNKDKNSEKDDNKAEKPSDKDTEREEKRNKRKEADAQERI